MTTQVFPAYAVIAMALVLLAVSLLYSSMRLLSRRRVQCPADATQADVLVELRRTNPWSKGGAERVLQCSHSPGAVTCNQACLQRDRVA